jgi:hypothetical protein
VADETNNGGVEEEEKPKKKHTLGPAARKKLGRLAAHAERTIRDMIRERGGSEANVREAGPWAGKTLADAAEAAVNNDKTAAKAIIIVKQAKRLGEKA